MSIRENITKRFVKGYECEEGRGWRDERGREGVSGRKGLPNHISARAPKYLVTPLMFFSLNTFQTFQKDAAF